MITIKDIAKESGYSLGTVSRALNSGSGVSDKAMKRIIEVVEKYDFRLNGNAKFLKQQSNNAVAVILKGAQNMLFISLTEILQKKIESAGFECLMFYLNEDDNEVEAAKRILRERKPEGIFFLGSNLEYFRDEFKDISIPCVIVTNDGSELGFVNLSSVSTDDSGSSEFIIDQLISLGHRRIGIIGGDPNRSTTSSHRYRGCLESFRKHGMDFDFDIQYQLSHFSLEEGYDGARKLLRKMPDVTAIYALCDLIAIGAIRAASDRGIAVPDELSVVGFDGIDIADYMMPRLTTVRQNRETIAEKSMEIMFSMMRNGSAASHEIIPFSFIPGNSIRNISMITEQI